MPDAHDRERALTAYASEVRAFHTFFGATLLAIGIFHLLVLVPYLQVRAAIPAVASRLASVEQQIRSADDAQKAVTAALAGVAQFRKALGSGPEQLRAAIAELVARGRGAVGPRGDPYKAVVRVSSEAAKPGGAPEFEDLLVEEEIRRQIGRQTEALGLALEAALESLRSFRRVPETNDALRVTQEVIGRETVSLNQTLRATFAADPNFWQRWNRAGSTFGAASPGAGEVLGRIEDALGALTRQLGAAQIVAKSRREEHQARFDALGARLAELSERAQNVTKRFAWMPLGLGDAARLYPIAAGALTLTVLFRLRRILRLRRALAGVDPELVAPSWVVGSPSSPGRWWALILIAAPLIATIHGSVAALADRGLFVNALGDPSRTMILGYGAAYTVLIFLGTGQLLKVTRRLLVAPRATEVPIGGANS